METGQSVRIIIAVNVIARVKVSHRAQSRIVRVQVNEMDFLLIFFFIINTIFRSPNRPAKISAVFPGGVPVGNGFF